MKFLDLFAGIGGFRLGMEQAGHECVGYVEWDKYARKSYEAIHDTEGEWTANDITSVTDGDLQLLRGKGIDIICGGFPCQSFSVAGKRGGFDDTRGTMFFEIARFAKQIEPRILLLENVKGLLSHNQGDTFRIILNTLDELGYDCEWQVLNSKNFGVPQNRERVFIVGHYRKFSRREVFPITGINGKAHINVVGNYGKTGHGNFNVHSPEGISPTLKARDYKDAVKIIQLNNPSQRIIYPDERIRRLTPLEYWRLQGFPDSAFRTAAEANSDSQLYKQAGNSVTVNVIKAIGEKL